MSDHAARSEIRRINELRGNLPRRRRETGTRRTKGTRPPSTDCLRRSGRGSKPAPRSRHLTFHIAAILNWLHRDRNRAMPILQAAVHPGLVIALSLWRSDPNDSQRNPAMVERNFQQAPI